MKLMGANYVAYFGYRTCDIPIAEESLRNALGSLLPCESGTEYRPDKGTQSVVSSVLRRTQYAKSRQRP